MYKELWKMFLKRKRELVKTQYVKLVILNQIIAYTLDWSISNTKIRSDIIQKS